MDQPLDKDKRTLKPSGGISRVSEMEELYRRLEPELRRTKPNPDAIAAALEAAQRLASEADAEISAAEVAQELTDANSELCAACGHRNRMGNRFCGGCGISLAVTLAPHQASVMEPLPQNVGNRAGSETHHYHHHYHHHYFPAGYEGGAPARVDAAREDRMRPTAALRGDMSRAEAAVRRVTHEWVLACNTKHLDDLLELYSADALVLRSNYPAVRGAAAVREFFFSALETGLGEVEMEPLRVEIMGDTAYEAGRCKALVPSASGKRREDRGKYLWVFARQGNGEWKLAADCWSSDLSLGLLESDVPSGIGVKTNPPKKSS